MERAGRKVIVLLLILVICTTCKDPFSFSPFEASVDPSLRNLNEKNLKKIQEIDSSANKPFKVALISDTHYHFNNLADAIADINRKEEYAFIIVTGDITENGLLKEFELFHSIMSASKIPYVAVIGNHDHLSNGATIYRQIYGPLNYSFVFGNTKFIAWDNTTWESNQEADIQWLKDALEETIRQEINSKPYHHTIMLAHIPPADGQMASTRELFLDLLTQNKVALSVHGHKHEFSYDTLENGIRYMTVGTPQRRNYAELHISPGEVVVQKIEY